MNKAAIALVILGIAQMAGDLLDVRAVRGIAAATNASPAPKVFSAVRGLETYSTRFFVEWDTVNGGVERLELTPATGARLQGAYNRRNVYGAALAYAPVLPAELRDPVIRSAMCGERPLLMELGIDPSTIAGSPRIVLEPLPGAEIDGLETRIEARCE